MRKENELTYCLDNPDLLIMAGSRLYGTNVEQSDYDYRGFIIPPFEYLIGLGKFEHHIIKIPDTVIYSLKRFFELLMLGDPTVYEILFAPESNIIERNNTGGTILHNRELFACKRFARRIGGYAQSEWRKVTGTQLVPIKRTSSEDEIIEDIRKVFHPQKEEMDEIVRLLLLQHPRETRPARRKLGAKRKAQIERYGYCTSSACHTIRLLGQLKELMDTGRLTFPRPDADMLSMIKNGELSLEEVSKIYEDSQNKATEAEKHTDLPDNAPINKIQDLYNGIIANTLLTNQRIKRLANTHSQRWEKWTCYPEF
jgi:hypothetical protein